MAAQNGYTNQHSLGALRHHRHDRGLVLQRDRRARLHLRDRSERVPPAVPDRSSTSTSAPASTPARATARPTSSRWRTLPTRTKHSVVVRQGSGRGHAATAQAVRHADLDGSSFTDRLDTTMTVPAGGSFTWHVNPRTRPLVMKHRLQVLAEEPTERGDVHRGHRATAEPTGQGVRGHRDRPGPAAGGARLADPGRLRPRGLPEEADGSLTEVASSGNFVGEKELRNGRTPRRPGPTSCASSTSRR